MDKLTHDGRTVPSWHEVQQAPDATAVSSVPATPFPHFGPMPLSLAEEVTQAGRVMSDPTYTAAERATAQKLGATALKKKLRKD